MFNIELPDCSNLPLSAPSCENNINDINDTGKPWQHIYIYSYIYIFIAALIFLLEYFRITRAFCILPYCTVYIVRYTTHARSE